VGDNSPPPFTLFTRTNFAVYAPAERVDTLPLFQICPICTLLEKPYDSLCLSLSNADDVKKVDILQSHKGASYIEPAMGRSALV
jgi:hypothetical protein